MQANCSTSFSPGNSGNPVYNSANMHPAKSQIKVKFVLISILLQQFIIVILVQSF